MRLRLFQEIPLIFHVIFLPGGEAALIGGGGSFLGIGTDIDGSVRCPAHFCGIASLKPTARRIPNSGIVSSCPGIVGGNFYYKLFIIKLVVLLVICMSTFLLLF